MADETPKKRFFKVIEKDIRIRETPEYPGKKVKKRILSIDQEICVIQSQEFIFKDQVLIFYLLKDSSGWVIDYSPGAKKRVLKEIFRTVGDKATANLVQEKLHHLRLCMQARMKRVEREKATAQRDLNKAITRQREQNKLLQDVTKEDDFGSNTAGMNANEYTEQIESLKDDLEKSKDYKVLSLQKEQTIIKLQGLLKKTEYALEEAQRRADCEAAKNKIFLEEKRAGESSNLKKLRLMLAETEARAIEAEKKLSQKCSRISALKTALKQRQEGENYQQPAVLSISQQQWIAVTSLVASKLSLEL